jgi:hypothetical protein
VRRAALLVDMIFVVLQEAYVRSAEKKLSCDPCKENPPSFSSKPLNNRGVAWT